MRARALSLHEALFPVEWPEFEAVAEIWTDAVVQQALQLVWDGFERMKARHFQGFDLTVDYEQLERGLTSLHAREILLLWKEGDGFDSFIPKPEECEWRARASRTAKPPAIDIAFESAANPSLHFAVEAKVLDDPNDVARYIADLEGKYLVGKASPLVPVAAQAGYLRSGNPSDVLSQLEKCLGVKLATSAAFVAKAHRVSSHMRKLRDSEEETPFSCHHLILGLT